MADTTLPGLLATGDHASRSAAGDVGTGALYSCTDHNLVYQSDGSSWSTWATLGGGSGGSNRPYYDAVAIDDPGSGDLFGGTSLDGGWSDLDTALTTKDASIDGYLVLGNNASIGNDFQRGLYRTFSPSGDFTVYARIDNLRGSANYVGAGIMVGSSSPGNSAGNKRLDVGFYRLSGSDTHCQMNTWSSGTKTNIFDASIGDTPLLLKHSWDGRVIPIWLAIQRVGSNISAGFSEDGIEFQYHGTTTTISFTVDTLGVVLMQQGTNIVRCAYYDYIASIG